MAPEPTMALELDAVRTALASAQRLILAAEDEGLRMRAEVERLRNLSERRESAAPARGTKRIPDAPRPAAVEPSVRTLAVLDVDASWESVAPGGRQVVVLRLAVDLPAALGAVGPDRILVNLAVPGAFEAVAALRASGCGVPLWGCLASVGQLDAIALGPIEPMPLALDPDRVLAFLAGRGERRVLLAGTDGERLIALRHRLTHAGLSVSIAWDGKQAENLLDMLVPDLAIVDLALPPRGGHALVARLGTIDPPPLTLLVPSGADPATGFSVALAERLRGGVSWRRAALLDRACRTRPSAETNGAPPRK